MDARRQAQPVDERLDFLGDARGVDAPVNVGLHGDGPDAVPPDDVPLGPARLEIGQLAERDGRAEKRRSDVKVLDVCRTGLPHTFDLQPDLDRIIAFPDGGRRQTLSPGHQQIVQHGLRVAQPVGFVLLDVHGDSLKGLPVVGADPDDTRDRPEDVHDLGGRPLDVRNIVAGDPDLDRLDERGHFQLLPSDLGGIAAGDFRLYSSRDLDVDSLESVRTTIWPRSLDGKCGA